MNPQLHPTSVADGHVPVPARPPHRYVYDGMRVIQTRQGNNTPYVSYTRGTDLNGSLEGAGGIGGLLARSHLYSGGNWYLHNFYHADGNGNVTYLVNSSQGLAASYYRYDPYGNLISQSGSLASANVYRFSSKESLTHNPQSGAAMEYYYYGYRWYAPNVQRWPNRDPIEENGGINLYGFVLNDSVNSVDIDGLQLFPPILLEPPIPAPPPRLLLPAPKPRLMLPPPRPPGSKPVPPGMGYPKFPKLPKECWKNPAKQPGEGFQWRGPDAPGGPRGGWYNPKTGETLKPDLNHPKPVNPHWDYIDPKGYHWRIYPDGRIGLAA